MHHAKPQNTLFTIEQNTAYEAHMQSTIRLVRAEADRLNLSEKPVLPLSGLVAKQLRFLAWKIWLFQGMVLALLCSVFFLIYTTNLSRWNGNTLPKFLCGCSAVIVMSAIPILKRASTYKMFELEQATHFAVRGSILSQLLFIGIGDFCMLLVLALIGRICKLTISVILLSLIIPFLTASIACLMLWTRTTPDSFPNAGVLLCLLSSLFSYEIIDKSSYLHPAAQLCLLIGYSLICIGALCHEYRRLFLRKPIEKML